MRYISRFSKAGILLGIVCLVLTIFSVVWLRVENERLLDQIPKRKAQGRELRLEHHMALGFHRAAWAGVVVGLAGLATIRWWGREGGPAGEGDIGGPDASGTAGRKPGILPSGWVAPVHWRQVAVMGLVGMAMSGWMRWPRLGHSFWSDEAYAARAYVWGLKQPRPDGTLAFVPVSWTDALYLNERANNQVWCSIEARLAHRMWRGITGAPADVFSERVLRAPAFVWGLFSVAAISVLGAMVGGRTGALAGLLLAVHPWHVRFGAEMRGYSAMLLALILGLLFLLLALRDDRWRWWLLAAAANLWAMLAFAGSLHVPLVCSAVAVVLLAWRRRWNPLARMMLANAFAAVAFLWIYGPSLTQLKAYLDRGSDVAAYTVSLAWLKQFGESLCLGVPWAVMGDAWRDATHLPSATAAAVAAGTVGFFFLYQLAVTIWFRPRLLIIPALLALAALLSIAQSMAAGTILLMWYLLPVVIGWVLIIAVGTGLPPRRAGEMAGRRRWGTWVSVGGLGMCFAIWTAVSQAMARVPRQPMREASLQWSGVGPWPAPDSRSGSSEPVMLAVVGISDGQMKLYAPEVVLVKTLADLQEAEAQAQKTGRKLWISVGGWEATMNRSPEVLARLNQGGFEHIAHLPGWEPMFSYSVWRQR